jgi:M6 family metalloprotease-like protein
MRFPDDMRVLTPLHTELPAFAQPLIWLSVIALLLSSDRVLAQAPQTLEGTLIVTWGDPDTTLASGGETRFELALPDGRVARLQLRGQENVAVGLFARRVRISGQLVPGQTVENALAFGTLIVDSITRADSIVDLPPITNVSGTRRVIYLLAKYSDDINVPHAPSFYTDLNNPDVPPVGAPFPATVNGFFKKTSWNQFWWLADVGGVGGVGAPGGWLTLPHPKSFYAPCGFTSTCVNLNGIAEDALAAGRAQGIDFTMYDNVNFVMSNDLDCCSWGGGYFSAVDNKSYGATWVSPRAQYTSVFAHELSHSIGLPHSGWVYYAYDSPWDLMSTVVNINMMSCGSYLSVNSGMVMNLGCSEPGDDISAPYKDYLQWIPPANIVNTDTLSTVTVALEGLTLPLGSAIKMIKVCLAAYPCTGFPARYLTVEARVRGLGTTSQFDNGIPNEGIIIQEVRRDRPAISGRCFSNAQSGWALPIDVSGGDYDSANCTTGGRAYPNYGLNNAQFVPGQSYTSAYGVTISVLNRVGSTFTVSVSPGTGPAITPASATIGSGQTATLNAPASPLSYQWYLGSPGIPRNPVAGATLGTYTTLALTSSKSYWVRTSNSTTVADSAAAIVTIGFTDNTLVAGASEMKAVHLTELRSRVDALLQRFGRPAMTWTDPSLSSGSLIKATHIAELRGALTLVYSVAFRSPPTYTDQTLGPGTLVKLVHVQELRNAVNALEID